MHPGLNREKKTFVVLRKTQNLRRTEENQGKLCRKSEDIA
jgi:hypothetical protein